MSLLECPVCRSRYHGAVTRCPFDGAALVGTDHDLMGALLGERFTPTRLLGAGAVGAVYEATDRLGGAVAVKLLHADLARDPGHRERFHREARAMMRVRHRSVVDILATSEPEAPLPWLAMALCDGPSLAARVARGPLPAASARKLVGSIADGLASAHGAGVVHRDLKPSNVVSRRSNEDAPIVVDFGLASVQGEPGVTETGELVGTAHTMSPEQIDGRAPCPAMDHYALGCVWFELVTGRPPFIGKTSAVLHAHVSSPPPSTASLGVELPAEDRGLLDGLLSKAADERAVAFATLVEVARATATD